MGCSSGKAAGNTLNTVRPDPEQKEVTLADGSKVRVDLASASLVYSLLVSQSDGSFFIDVRAQQDFDRAHLFGAWCMESGPTSKNDEANAPKETFLRTRCALRSVVLCGREANALQDASVLKGLLMLHELGVRPKGNFLVLRGGHAGFATRFPFCMRNRGAESSRPLPSCPAAVLGPESGMVHPSAVYLGTERCVKDAGAAAVLSSLKIKCIISLGNDASHSRVKGCRALAVPLSTNTQDARIAAARDACEKLKRQTEACLLYGPGSALAVAFFLTKMLPGIARSADEAASYIKLRYPSVEFETSERIAVSSGAVDKSTARIASVSSPAPPQGQPPAPQPVAPPPGPANGDASAPPTHVEQVCNAFRKRDRRAAETSLATVTAALSHVLKDPNEAKFRRLKGSNERVKKELLAHPEAIRLLRLCGFVRDGEDLVLPPTAPLQALRDLLQHLPESNAPNSWKP